MNKNFLLPLLSVSLIGLAGCGPSYTETPVGGTTPIDNTTPVDDTTPSTDITEVARNGYAALNYDPTNVGELPVPAGVAEGKSWVEDTAMSDDFDYEFAAATSKTNFGEDRWYNFYHADWDGPGSTYWKHDHISVEDGNLTFKVSRSASSGKQDIPGVDAGVITSTTQVVYPAYVEASVSLADISLASAVWLLSPDDTQEIDIMEMYAGAGASGGNGYFSKLVHLSHHSFIRDPFTDYQPKDKGSWWKSDIDGFASWGEFAWNGGDRQYIQIGTNWISPWHFEYYIDGELVRVLYHNAFATKMDGTWSYTYPVGNANNEPTFGDDGYQSVEVYASNDDDFNFATLEAASNESTVSVIDPYDYQNGQGFYNPADIIINMELQDWWQGDLAPTDAELADDSGKNKMLVDWIRVYKPN